MNKLKFIPSLVLMFCAAGNIFGFAAVRRQDTAFKTFFAKFKSAVARKDKRAVMHLSQLPVWMPAYQKSVRTKIDFLRRYNHIFNGEANAARCFAQAAPIKRDAKSYEIYCPFRQTPDDWENAPIKYRFELSKSGWKFAGLDNINE